MLFDLTKENFNDFVHKTSGFVLVEFYSPTCKSCQTLLTILEDISDDYYGKLKVFKINTEAESELADTCDIFSLPTMVLFQNEHMVRTLTGLQNTTKIESWLNL